MNKVQQEKVQYAKSSTGEGRKMQNKIIETLQRVKAQHMK